MEKGRKNQMLTTQCNTLRGTWWLSLLLQLPGIALLVDSVVHNGEGDQTKMNLVVVKQENHSFMKTLFPYTFCCRRTW